MKINEKIKELREQKHWSQEEIAKKMHISSSSYSKIERGETRLTLDRLEQFAEIFDIEISKLINLTDNGVVCLFSENNSENNNGTQYGNFYQGSENLIIENEKLKLELQYKDELLNQKDNELVALKKLLAVYEKETP